MNQTAVIMGIDLEKEESPISPERSEAVDDESDSVNYGNWPRK